MANFEWVSLPLLAAGTVGIAYFVNRNNHRNGMLLRREGVRINQLTKQLLHDAQQHRGMANALLNGDKTFGAKLGQKQAEIDRDIAALDALHSRILVAEKRWDSIREAWQSLRKEVLSLTAEDSFRRHSGFIRAIIYLMGDVAERSQLIGKCATDTALVSALWSKLPVAAEGLAQARGLGAGVAAKGQCSSVARTRLRFLEGRIRETMKWVSDDLKRADPSQAAPMLGLWKTTDKTVSDFLALLERTIINAEKPSIDAEHYFGSATKTIDALFSVFDQVSSGHLKKNLAG
ncbi:MAG: hypothetical protein A3F73_09220 [Gallionellales bacterium RIFCSPLOWO2_12_FULL_59_22]|nr:MAG: hypothetical protein A3H99_04055 [Gallionellales bacterium RIFCSPLOWO2_02_FULL_59_110]OGT05472.1 MAG: hypothetical protein A2Z65_09515 [Gallionellales bacterium RIFCSPLOWO2_02_58_13]OGT14591.1 MAG: hypothetical protein A3F73_09220 [Gallionellales bacterium RIFCSPLOWO2_12_FULL_59_22]